MNASIGKLVCQLSLVSVILTFRQNLGGVGLACFCCCCTDFLLNKDWKQHGLLLNPLQYYIYAILIAFTLQFSWKMGLLSDPEYGSAQWVRVLRKIHGLLSVLFYIGAIGWFVMLGNKTFNNETYFSENALLPGLVTNEFNGEPAAKQFFNEFQEELKVSYPY